MKNLFLILAYIIGSLLFYLLFCAIGLIWFKWNEIIYSTGFNTLYWFIIGWWLMIPICQELDEKY